MLTRSLKSLFHAAVLLALQLPEARQAVEEETLPLVDPCAHLLPNERKFVEETAQNYNWCACALRNYLNKSYRLGETSTTERPPFDSDHCKWIPDGALHEIQDLQESDNRQQREQPIIGLAIVSKRVFSAGLLMVGIGILWYLKHPLRKKERPPTAEMAEKSAATHELGALMSTEGAMENHYWPLMAKTRQKWTERKRRTQLNSKKEKKSSCTGIGQHQTSTLEEVAAEKLEATGDNHPSALIHEPDPPLRPVAEEIGGLDGIPTPESNETVRCQKFKRLERILLHVKDIHVEPFNVMQLAAYFSLDVNKQDELKEKYEKGDVRYYLVQAIRALRDTADHNFTVECLISYWKRYKPELGAHVAHQMARRC